MANWRAIVFAAALAGLIVGLVVTVAQRFGTVPLILHAEVYEQAAEAAELRAPAAPHEHAPAAVAGPDDDVTTAAPQGQGHEHGAEAWEPANGFERTAYTALFNVLDWIGFGLMLIGLLVLLGRPVTWREGFLWGLGGFAAFVIAPGLGLPPELPGIPAAPLTPRQIWWVATVAVTATALWLIVFRPGPLWAALAILLLAAPHVIGAPQLAAVVTNVPEHLSHRFVVAVTLTTLLSWALLGGLSGYLYQRFARPS
jgi:cobalt transporter subunit CbtA